MNDVLQRLAETPASRRAIGAFQLVEQLGKGGFAPVWLAKEIYGATELRTVAIKLFAATGGTETNAERIAEEARALCQVEHPNVVRFHSMFHDAQLGVVGLVMEHVHGIALDRRLEALAEGQRLALDDVIAVGAAIASALAAVHQAGLVHRDVKPANVIDAGGVYKLIDFGIAATRHQEPKTRPAKTVVLDDLPLASAGTNASTLATDAVDAITGTIGYIDPQCLSRMVPATASSDLYALGATLYECLTGGVPAAIAARADGTRGLKGEVLDGRAQPPPVAEIARVPSPLASIVDALVQADPVRRPKSAEAVAWELERIRRELAGRARPLPPESVGPFRGLGRFEEADRDVYFGRGVELAAAIETLRSRGLVALVGPSGSGKSSLARAGVLPAIADGALGKWPKQWDAVVTAPGAEPKTALSAALGHYVEDAGSRSPEAIVVALAERAQTTGRGIVVLVDQLEELVTQSSVEGRRYAAQLLAAMGAQTAPGVRCVVAARRDLLDALLALEGLGRVLTRGTVLVAPMTDATWGDVIDQALDAYGYRLESDAMRADLHAQLEGTASAMPLVQFALTELWARRDSEQKMIPRAALDAIGGIAGALERHAESSVARYAGESAGALEAIREVLLALTTPQGTRRTRTRDELTRDGSHPLSRAVLERLEAKRLVIAEAEGVTLAHEALLTQWARLAAWIAEAREDRVLAETIERDAREWSKGREPERLWKKRRLTAALDLVKRATVPLSDDSKEFIELARRAERRAKALPIAGLVTALVVVIGIVFFTFYARTLRLERNHALNAEMETRAALDAAQRARAEAQQARQEAEEARRQAEEAQMKAAEAAAKFHAELSDLEERIKNTLSADELRKLAMQVAQRAAETRPSGLSETGGGRGEGIGLGGAPSSALSSSAPPKAGGAPKMAPGPVSVSGGLKADVVVRIVRQQFGRFRLCYDAGLRMNRATQGRVVVRFVIGGNGSVSAASDGGSTISDPNVIACVVRGFQSMTFPQPEDGGVVTASFAIDFAPGE